MVPPPAQEPASDCADAELVPAARKPSAPTSATAGPKPIAKLRLPRCTGMVRVPLPATFRTWDRSSRAPMGRASTGTENTIEFGVNNACGFGRTSCTTLCGGRLTWWAPARTIADSGAISDTLSVLHCAITHSSADREAVAARQGTRPVGPLCGAPATMDNADNRRHGAGHVAAFEWIAIEQQRTCPKHHRPTSRPPSRRASS